MDSATAKSPTFHSCISCSIIACTTTPVLSERFVACMHCKQATAIWQPETGQLLYQGLQRTKQHIDCDFTYPSDFPSSLLLEPIISLWRTTCFRIQGLVLDMHGVGFIAVETNNQPHAHPRSPCDFLCLQRLLFTSSCTPHSDGMQRPTLWRSCLAAALSGD